VDGGKQSAAASGIFAAKATQVAFVKAPGDEIGESFLFEVRGLPVAEPLGGKKSAHQALGRDDVADAKRGKDGAREGTDVDDAAFLVESLEGFERLAVVAKLAVVVVFDNDGVATLGPIEKSQAPGERQYHAGGELVRRCDEGKASIRG